MGLERAIARILRYGIVTQFLNSGEITREDAAEILSGCLTPDDEETRFDDSALLNESPEKAIELIRESEDTK